MAAILGGRLTPPTNFTAEPVRRLVSEIEDGKLRPGARLPTEQEIVNSAGVSRSVAGEAISALRALGLIATRQGAGAFVAPNARRQPFDIDPEKRGSLTRCCG